MSKLGGLAALLLVGTSSAAWAAPQPAAPGGQDTGGQSNSGQNGGGQNTTSEGVATSAPEIVVTGEQRGSVLGDIQPEQVLSPADVRAYGVSSIQELLTELGQQVGSMRGRSSGMPVVLLNGQRISDFREMRDIPTEAIARVEILPEEVALNYGYRADQRVVNIVLRQRFRSFTGEVQAGMPTAGGYADEKATMGVMRMNNRGRINLNVEYSGRSRLTEDERDVLPTTSTGLYDVLGNIAAPGSVGSGAGEIDPALSLLAGQNVTVAGVPASAANGAPTLDDFVASANQANANGLTRYRTLLGAQESLKINTILSRALSENVTATINGELTTGNSESWLGLRGATILIPAGNPYSPFGEDVALYRYYTSLSPITRYNDNRAAHLGLGLTGSFTGWRWSVSGNYDYSTSETTTTGALDTTALQAAVTAGDPDVNPFAEPTAGMLYYGAPDRARSTSSIGRVDAQIGGSPLSLPTGEVVTSLRLTGSTSDYNSHSVRSGVSQSSRVSRDTVNGQFNVNVPVAGNGVLDAIGDISLNGNVEAEHLSGFGTLVTYGYGANWEPVDRVGFLVSITEEEGAPTAAQLGDPTVVTPNVTVFDYTRGESVVVTQITGNNPGLRSDSRHVMKIGFNAHILDAPDLRFNADFVRSVTHDEIASLPAATAAIEAAFPDRFIRDSSGQLVSVDTRAVNFARSEREELRYGINFSLPLVSTIQRRMALYRAAREEAERNGTTPPPLPEGLRPPEGGRGTNGPGANGPGGAMGGPGGFGRGPMGGGRGPMGGRIQLSLYHTIHLRDTVLIREGLPELDRLNGDASGSQGGQSRHEVELRAGVVKDGIGMRLTANWQSATHVNGGTTAAPEPLRFSSLGTVGLRWFVDMGQQLSLVRDHRWLRGARVSLSVENVFDARLRVTNATGEVPLSYQPDLIDPVGRRVQISFRKLFF